MSGNGGGAEGEVRAWLEAHVGRIAPLMREANLAAWDAATTGDEGAQERSARGRTALKEVYTDAEDARRVRAWLASDGVADPLLRRQLVLLGNDFTANQLPKETIEDLVRRATELEHAFTTFRAELDGERVTNNRILEVLGAERDEAVRKRAWEASKQIGAQVADRLRELVRRRNAAARSLGFDNYYAMELSLQELDEARLFRVLDDFAARTDEPFRRFRAGVDARLAARFGVDAGDLRPWHWEDPFAQEAPAAAATVELDGFFGGADPVEVGAAFFRGIGLDVDDVLARSDLYEREGKDQHAFCVDMDHEGDVRVLCNMLPNEKWMGTLLHELGHAAYDKYVPRALPWLLRQPAHTLSTEAVAMYMGRLTRDPAWLRDVMGAQVPDAEAADVRAQLRAAMLIATRWMLVMAYFERELYRDPDRPDLNRLWWELVERFQLIRRPEGRQAEGDWASKIHLSGAPVYYHNYLLGELMASQLSAGARAGMDGGRERSIAGEESVGRFFREKIFGPGASVDWNGLLVHATGEELTPRYFVEEFV